VIKLRLMAGVRNLYLSATSNISVTAGTEGSVTGRNIISLVSARASVFSVCERDSPAANKVETD